MLDTVIRLTLYLCYNKQTFQYCICKATLQLFIAKIEDCRTGWGAKITKFSMPNEDCSIPRIRIYHEKLHRQINSACLSGIRLLALEIMRSSSVHCISDISLLPSKWNFFKCLDIELIERCPRNWLIYGIEVLVSVSKQISLFVHKLSLNFL